jgi:hypothetical protein
VKKSELDQLLSAIVIAIGCGRRMPLQRQAGPDESTLVEAFDAARLRVEFHGGDVDVLVIGPATDDATAEVLKRHRAGIFLHEVPASSDLALPARYFLLKSFQLAGHQGAVSGTLGPVQRSKPGVASLSCGTTFNLELNRSPGGWLAKVSSLPVC